MTEYLVDHAVKNVWCTPNQDRQSRIKAVKLTGYGGAWNSLRVLRRTISLPEAGPRFHVYQIGSLAPFLLGLLDSHRKWTSLAQACSASNMVANVYVKSGLQLMLSQVWYMITPEKDLILAVKEPNKIPVDLNTEDLFLRVYSNAYFNKSRNALVDDSIKVISSIPRNTQEILALQKQYAAFAAKPGVVTVTINGVIRPKVDLVSIAIGDNVEFLYDSSVSMTVDLPLANLPYFTSTLDKKQKYLLHYPGNGSMIIDYFDDIDLFLIKPEQNGQYAGLYYHYNAEDAIRMVTHKDYAVPVPYVHAYLNGPTGWENKDELMIRMVVRKAGYDRPLVEENSRIKELYKLPDGVLIDAMIGLDAVVPHWTAAALEASAYTDLMRADITEINKQLVEDAYGYNAISKLIGDTPQQVTSINGRQGARVPYVLQRQSTAYEYDGNGYLIGWYDHPVGPVYFTVNANATLVEFVSGSTRTGLDDVYGQATQTLDLKNDYRMYVCDVTRGAASNKWRDVTGSGLYAVVGNKLTWFTDPTKLYTLVRSNARNHGYDVGLSMRDGMLKFALNQHQIRKGEESLWVAQVPQGEYDFWLNGRSLIEGIDFIFNFPEVVIISKRHLVNASVGTQKLTVRGTGFCDANFGRVKALDVGYVAYGVLSHNKRYNLRDDKVNRIVVAGKTMHRSSLKFSENDPTVTVPNAANGSPYMVRDIVVPLRGEAVSDTYGLRDKSMVIDAMVSDYLTDFAPEPVPTTPNVLPGLYELYSPFLSKIIHDLRSGALTNPLLTTDYNDNEVMEVCKPYEALLKFDPTQPGLQPDSDYTIIHPHNLMTVLDVNVFQYRFILRVINIYMQDAVTSVSHFLTLTKSN